MSGIMLPAPGSLAAVDRGCRCVVRAGVIRMDPRCILHGTSAHAPVVTDNGESRNASPIRLPGDAWGCP